ncbi:hypothetical protein IFM89_001270 [Coptis chinensis]|uniref:Uncharacterized protein n=1 Tax=Coptis chinensis TaxID=261450 RepID=A0A835H2L1_9MAGN|nr:hypothetical protein IFM89_001270 [Coptis chinensis]
MRITLWENAVDLVDKDIINSTVDQPVVVVTSLTVDIYTGVYYLNSTRATKIYFNLAIPELQHLMNSPKNKTIELLEGSASTDRISSTRQLKNRKTLSEILNSLDRDTIVKLLYFIITSSLPFQLFILTLNARYQIQARIQDHTNRSIVTIFGKEAETLVKHPASELEAMLKSASGSQIVKNILNELIGSSLIF